jgi:hypothetical protein
VTATAEPFTVPKRDTALELLRELVAGQREIIALLSNSANSPILPPSFLSRGDRALLQRALPAIAGVYGPATFSSRDLVEDDAPAVRLVLRGLSVKRISKLFARSVGIPIDGLLVRKHSVELQVTQWQIVAACWFRNGFQTLHGQRPSGSISVGAPDA